MEEKLRFVSTDDHVIEHPDVWLRRLSRAKWGGRIPHVERDRDGSDYWMIDGARYRLCGNGSVGALMADRRVEPETWERMPQAAYIPSERLKAMDANGADFSVLYPTIAGIAGEVFGRIADTELELACVQAYNDWLIEEWAGCSARFVLQCIVPISSVAASVAEIERAAAKGHRGVIYPAVPRHLRSAPHINDRAYDPLWRVCAEIGLPICFHAGCSAELELPSYEGYSPGLAAAFQAIARPAAIIPVVSNLIVSRILERFPDLKVVFAESSAGWLGFALEATDYEFDQFRVMEQVPYGLRPSEAFRRQCYTIGWYGGSGLRRACEYPGAGNVMWSANFPFATSSWPDVVNEEQAPFRDLPREARKQVLWRNAAQLYRLPHV
jgi:predicted TIM-barrel fold metal-dependent hydrolase